jgi:hypothetical protein
MGSLKDAMLAACGQTKTAEVIKRYFREANPKPKRQGPKVNRHGMRVLTSLNRKAAR